MFGLDGGNGAEINQRFSQRNPKSNTLSNVFHHIPFSREGEKLTQVKVKHTQLLEDHFYMTFPFHMDNILPSHLHNLPSLLTTSVHQGAVWGEDGGGLT